ncbi:hypothetical protein XA68_11662 [Ophiocordyceps unilateralis]|uniref:Uncharacterized protein n=1 Tax=Ophiocordyceps unilateralis TaxID=268505 RepID=A0A2A9PGD2_OPHUN|nr:hypothetical protein XA68_11662 [Ophiocordyceps unilateralis]
MAFSSGAFRPGGAHHGIFRPPVPSSTCLRPSLDAATPKRRRNDTTSPSRRPRNPVIEVYQDDEDDQQTLPKTPVSFPAPVPRHRTYTLAGHLDTPNSGPDDSSLLDESMYSDSNYRRALGSKRPRDDVDVADPSRPTPLFSLPAEPVPPRTWSALALDTIGGVVGRVLDFCTAGAFRGFYAGGGEGYYLSPEHLSGCAGVVKDDSGGGAEFRVPGHYPQGGYLSMDVAAPSMMMMMAPAADNEMSPTVPAAKRRQTSMANELGRNWVMVQEPRESDGTRRRTSYQRGRVRGTATARRGTPGDRLLSARLHASASSWSGTAERSCLAVSPASARSPSPNKQASRTAATGPSASASSTMITTAAGLGPPASTSAASTAGGGGRRRTLLPPGQGMAHRRTHSNASTASSRGCADEVESSPRLNAEAKKLAARRKMEERDADVRIEAFNKQLQAMIRQGREALGTTIEVEGGWEDDD